MTGVLNTAALAGMGFGVYAAPENLRGIALILACGFWWLKPHPEAR